MIKPLLKPSRISCFEGRLPKHLLRMPKDLTSGAFYSHSWTPRCHGTHEEAATACVQVGKVRLLRAGDKIFTYMSCGLVIPIDRRAKCQQSNGWCAGATRSSRKRYLGDLEGQRRLCYSTCLSSRGIHHCKCSRCNQERHRAEVLWDPSLGVQVQLLQMNQLLETVRSWRKERAEWHVGEV